jgi:DNA-binding response OmpR family regulator
VEQPPLLLMAEDESLIAITLQDALEDAGFGVHHVIAGPDAIQALDQKRLGFAGVITDIKLGGAVDGWAVARRARELMPHVPVVYMSGDSAHEHTVQGVPDSMMLQKPFASTQLVIAISTLLNAAPQHRPD